MLWFPWPGTVAEEGSPTAEIPQAPQARRIPPVPEEFRTHDGKHTQAATLIDEKEDSYQVLIPCADGRSREFTLPKAVWIRDKERRNPDDPR